MVSSHSSCILSGTGRLCSGVIISFSVECVAVKTYCIKIRLWRQALSLLESIFFKHRVQHHIRFSLYAGLFSSIRTHSAFIIWICFLQGSHVTLVILVVSCLWCLLLWERIIANGRIAVNPTLAALQPLCTCPKPLCVLRLSCCSVVWWWSSLVDHMAVRCWQPYRHRHWMIEPRHHWSNDM